MMKARRSGHRPLAIRVTTLRHGSQVAAIFPPQSGTGAGHFYGYGCQSAGDGALVCEFNLQRLWLAQELPFISLSLPNDVNCVVHVNAGWRGASQNGNVREPGPHSFAGALANRVVFR